MSVETPSRKRSGAKIKARNPLSPATYLIRNAGKSLPLTAVIVFAVLLVASIISLINSIPYSVRTIYVYSRQMLGITPRGDPTLTPKLIEQVRREAPVPIERIAICRATGTQVKSIVGPWPFVVLGLSQEDMQYYMRRQGVKSIVGRLPRAGAPEVVISRPIAQNLRKKLGSVLQGPDLDESYSPQPVRVVGIADTDSWVVVGSLEYQRANHFPPVDLALVFARNLKDQNTLDHWAEKRFRGAHAEIFAYFQVDGRTDKMFTTLYQILNVVIGMLVLVITFMMGLLINIYQSQRLIEFGLLQAIGYTRRQVLRRVLAESTIVVIAGWALGVLVAYVMLNIVKQTVMDPNAFAMNTMDPMAFGYTVPLPAAILLVAFTTVMLRFRKFDPVGVVERRLV